MTHPTLDPSGMAMVVVTLRLPAAMVEEVDGFASASSRALGVGVTRSDAFRWILQPDSGKSILATHEKCLADAAPRAPFIAMGLNALGAEPRRQASGLANAQQVRVSTEGLDRMILRVLGSRGPKKILALSELSKCVGRPRRDLFQSCLLELEHKGTIVLSELPAWHKVKPAMRQAAVVDPKRGELLAAKVTRAGIGVLRGRRKRRRPPQEAS